MYEAAVRFSHINYMGINSKNSVSENYIALILFGTVNLSVTVHFSDDLSVTLAFSKMLMFVQSDPICLVLMMNNSVLCSTENMLINMYK